MPDIFRVWSKKPSLLAALLCLLLAGCETKPPLQSLPPDAATQAQPGGNSVILAQFNCRTPQPIGFLDRPEYSPASQIPALWNMEFVLGDASSAGMPNSADSRKDFHSVSAPALAGGWLALHNPPVITISILPIARPSNRLEGQCLNLHG